MLPSKIYESYVLNWAQSEVKLRSNQYGGVKGCGTSHLLIGVWDEVMRGLEDDRASIMLTSVDYAKAFNRLSFQRCLEAFARLGASTPVIELIATFLSNRSMTVRVGDCWSAPWPVYGEVPQGFILGVFLFNAATDDLEGPAPPAASPTSDEESEGRVDDDWSNSEVEDDNFAVSTPVANEPGYILPPDDSPVRARPPPVAHFLPVESNAIRSLRAAVQRIAYSSEEDEEVPVEYSKKNLKWRE